MFPQHFAETSLRPNIVLVSETTKAIVMLRLTVPWEERKEEAYEWKRGESMTALSATTTGWKEEVEVGCRGFEAQSLESLC